MSTAKYNWEEIKQKYLEAPEIEVENFLRTFLELDPKKPLSGDKKTKTKGWREQKESILKTQTENARKELENDPSIKLKNQNILKAINNIESKVAFLLGTDTKFSKEDLPKIKVGWEMLRVSQNLPTTYSKNENENSNREIQIVKTIKIDESNQS